MEGNPLPPYLLPTHMRTSRLPTIHLLRTGTEPKLVLSPRHGILDVLEIHWGGTLSSGVPDYLTDHLLAQSSRVRVFHVGVLSTTHGKKVRK